MLSKLQKIQKENKGFTIIEVMIVLAVAGLIMLIVLVAIPQLQRNQRNAARRDVMGRIKTEIDTYATNNNGDVPLEGNDATKGFDGGFKTRYLGTDVDIKDPSTGAAMGLATWTNDAAGVAQGSIYYKQSRKCDGEASVAATGSRNYILMTKLEGGAVYCLDNSN